MQDRLITISELAGMLRVPKSYIYRLNHEGRGPDPIRLGNRTVRYRQDDINKWLRQLTDIDQEEENIK